MNKVNKFAVVNYSAAQMYDLVNDIKNYPQFLPMCYDVEIFEQTETQAKASLKIKSGFAKLDLATHNTMVKNQHIHLNLISGPFKTLTGDWNFEPQDENSCKVSLDMEFTFENKFVEIALGPVFRGLANKMLEAFCKRAEEVYK
ncbi:type II toxin-antitoxin system RatA family toxin [Allofrancisella frigidaquae]|uniref:Type II toxin-antitoxin system RatA family toxin n=1 Tax=Allofrancisella frigidaquae TaxID=1085644 RepID=A0A6M3HU27_9GAMM|nr:type II toxin-antitoxin system RatA family toxin [Allofrancisella frigidaquae]KEI35710.1 putative oligoketide cyclase/dehydratase or lipid transport protein YfjG [Francisella sp. W12-1067]QIV94597.1 type II toxin-antitoxin system RatA family toxin [Allofrancisella frigidaquae]